MSNKEERGRAFILAGKFPTLVDALKELNLEPPIAHLTVPTKKSGTFEVDVIPGIHGFVPSATWIKSIEKNETMYTSPTGKKRSFALSEFNSALNKHFLRDWSLNQRLNAKEKRFQLLVDELRDKLSPLAKSAMVELFPIAEEAGTVGVKDWFKKNGFNVDRLDPHFFDGLMNHLLKSRHPLSTWSIRSGPDGYGTSRGRDAVVDWDNRLLGESSWSSDD